MLKAAFIQSVILLLISSILSFFFLSLEISVAIITGGIIALANLKGLSWGVNEFVAEEGGKIKLVFFSFLRIAAVFAVLIFLIYYKLINAFGLLFGLTIVFIMIVKEGFSSGQRDSKATDL